MAKSKYKYQHGVLGFPRQVVRSDAYKNLSSNAKVLMLFLQDVWKPHVPVIHYSVRRAATMLQVSKNTACRAFQELSDSKFIVCINESDWLNGKAREWRLTWLSSNDKEPTNEWMMLEKMSV